MGAEGCGASQRRRLCSRWARAATEVATKERHGSHGHMALQHEARVVLAVRQVEELLAQLASGAQLGLGEMKPTEALERLEALRRLPHLLAQRVGPGVDLAHFRSRRALAPPSAAPPG